MQSDQIAIGKAREVIKEALKGKTDERGRDYYQTHVSPVVQAVSLFAPFDDPLKLAAYLHPLALLKMSSTAIGKMFGKETSELLSEVYDDQKKRVHAKSRRAILLLLLIRACEVSVLQGTEEKAHDAFLNASRLWPKK